jgi:tetratricopeptide (TPR) repeat protein
MQDLECFLTLTGLIFGSIVPTQVVRAQNGSPRLAVVPSNAPHPGAGLTQPGSTGETIEWGGNLTGRLMMDDGSVPPDSVTIERRCGALSEPVAYTDSRGRFSFQVGQELEVLPEASAGNSEERRVAIMTSIGGSTQEDRLFGSAGSRQLAGCQLQAALPGYRSDMVELGGRGYMDNPDVGTIVLRRLGSVEGTSISATSYEAPREAKKAYDKGVDAERKQRWPEAQAQFEKAVGLYPKYAAAWFELGGAFQHQGNKPNARAAFQKSVEADRRFLRPYFPLSVMAFEEKNWIGTVDLTTTLTRLDPIDYPLAYLFNAIANAGLGKLDMAEKSAREAVRLDTNHQLPRVEYILGLILADRHDYDGSLALLKSYVQHAPNAPDSADIKKQISQIETMAQAHPPAAQPGQRAPQH